ncbi:hypothetical protein [Patiriisocius sp. Uisw_017]|uniref:hypothetical protein n=1 Tax=Patiriisocius sp. Uisw_017 TaxID=3230968 RepID=UPI0039E91E68
MVTSYGVKENSYSVSMVDNDITIDTLFTNILAFEQSCFQLALIAIKLKRLTVIFFGLN